MMNAAAAGGYEISYSEWLAVGVPAAILISAAAIVLICLVWRPEASKFKNYDLDAHRNSIPKLSREGAITLVIFALVILYWVVPVVFPGLMSENMTALYNRWGTSLPLIIGMSLLCMIHVDNKPVADFRDMTSTSTITTLLFIGIVSVLGTAISSEAAGISACLNTILAPFTSSMSMFRDPGGHL